MQVRGRAGRREGNRRRGVFLRRYRLRERGGAPRGAIRRGGNRRQVRSVDGVRCNGRARARVDGALSGMIEKYKLDLVDEGQPRFYFHACGLKCEFFSDFYCYGMSDEISW